MGGVGTSALADPRTIIDAEQKYVIAPVDFFLPVTRPDGNRRDVDVLVKTTDPARIAEVREAVSLTVEPYLEASVFGIRPEHALQRQTRNPFGFAAVKTFLSDRYALNDQVIVKSLYPFAVPIDPESLENWKLVVGNDTTEYPIPHPGSTLANYTNRSITGLRPKDAVKVHAMAANINKQTPEVREWLMDGPGRSQLELSAVLRSLRYESSSPHFTVLPGIDVPLYTRSELADHPSFLARDLSAYDRRSLVGMAAHKAMH